MFSKRKLAAALPAAALAALLLASCAPATPAGSKSTSGPEKSSSVAIGPTTAENGKSGSGQDGAGQTGSSQAGVAGQTKEEACGELRPALAKFSALSGAAATTDKAAAIKTLKDTASALADAVKKVSNIEVRPVADSVSGSFGEMVDLVEKSINDPNSVDTGTATTKVQGFMQEVTTLSTMCKV